MLLATPRTRSLYWFGISQSSKRRGQGALCPRDEMAAKPDPWRSSSATRVRTASLSGLRPEPCRREPARLPPGLPPHHLVHPQAPPNPSASTSQLANEQTRRSEGQFASQACYRAVDPSLASTRAPTDGQPKARPARQSGEEPHHAEGVRGNRWFPRRGAGAEPLQKEPGQLSLRSEGRVLGSLRSFAGRRGSEPTPPARAHLPLGQVVRLRTGRSPLSQHEEPGLAC
jgi:hypothetical protein